MQEEAWDRWEEWLAQEDTRRFLNHLQRQGVFLQAQWLAQVWRSPETATDLEAMESRVRAQTYQDLASLSDPEHAKEIMSQLVNEE